MLSHNAERVWLYLCGCLNEPMPAPSCEDIAADLHLTYSEVQRALFWLEDAGKVHPGTTMPRQYMLHYDRRTGGALMAAQKPLTPATQRVWEQILQLRESGVSSPSYEEIGAACGIPENVVGNHLAALRAAGYLKQQAYWHRGVRLAKRPLLEQ